MDPVVSQLVSFAVAAGVTFLVTNGLKALGQLFGKDLSGASAGIAAALTAAVLVFAKSLLDLIPVQYQPVVSAIAGLVATVLSAYGIHYSLKPKS